MYLKSIITFSITFLLSLSAVSAQVCDDIIVNGCETSISDAWTKISTCDAGKIGVQYCHPKFYIGSGHNLSVNNTSFGKIVFDELLDKTTLSSGLKARKAVGKNEAGQQFTGIFTYNSDGDIDGCFIMKGADRSERIIIPE